MRSVDWISNVWGVGLSVTGPIRDNGRNVLLSSFRTGSNSGPRYFHVIFLVAFLAKAYIVNIKLMLTYLLTPCSTVLLEKLTSSRLVKKFHAFYGIRISTTAICPYAVLARSSPHPHIPLPEDPS